MAFSLWLCIVKIGSKHGRGAVFLLIMKINEESNLYAILQKGVSDVLKGVASRICSVGKPPYLQLLSTSFS